ncbi:hypothetical protein Bca52824_009873 [Brassica carinata]|uniref:Uncharacterized protein n=1 Tax=Brassica carinata TaxID=52824 RepID=A0A8X8B9K2_BRACI|nr:hypothetical protein Bca52824_009873 [Brassica carinata]
MACDTLIVVSSSLLRLKNPTWLYFDSGEEPKPPYPALSGTSRGRLLIRIPLEPSISADKDTAMPEPLVHKRSMDPVNHDSFLEPAKPVMANEDM